MADIAKDIVMKAQAYNDNYYEHKHSNRQDR